MRVHPWSCCRICGRRPYSRNLSSVIGRSPALRSRRLHDASGCPRSKAHVCSVGHPQLQSSVRKDSYFGRWRPAQAVHTVPFRSVEQAVQRHRFLIRCLQPSALCNCRKRQSFCRKGHRRCPQVPLTKLGLCSTRACKWLVFTVSRICSASPLALHPINGEMSSAPRYALATSAQPRCQTFVRL